MVRSERDVLSQFHIDNYEKLLVVCDRNPNLDGRSNHHNSDFCLIKDKKGGEHIEPTRDFCLKAIAVFGCNYEPVGPPTVVDDGKHKLVTRDVKVTLGDRYVVETGGASTEETSRAGARAFHDAMGVAATRGMKRALEALIGLPFVNMMIKELFGTYNVPEQERKPTKRRQEKPVNVSEPVKQLCNELYLRLKKAWATGVITTQERSRYWNKVLAAAGDYNQLLRERDIIYGTLEERGMNQEG